MSLNYKLEAGYHFSGNATDFSGNGNNGTVNGVTATTDKNGLANSAYSFDGTNSYIVTPIPATTDFTCSGWVKLDNLSNNDDTLFSRFDGASDYFLVLYRNDKSGFTFQYNIGSGGLFFNANGGQTTNWQHIVLTKQGTTYKWYINGVNTATTTISGILATNNPYIGGWSANTSNRFDGKIDEFRYYSRALTPYEINQLYYGYDTEQNQVGILNEGLEAAYHFSGDVTDWTGNGNALTYNGTTLTTDKNGVADKARYFDGVNDYVNTNTDGNLKNYTDWSVSVWSKISVSGDYKYIWGSGLSTTTNNFIGVSSDGSATQKYSIAYRNSNGSVSTAVPSSVTFADSQWHHIVLNYSHSVGQFTLWIDGNMEATLNASMNDISDLNLFTVGCLPRSSFSNFVNGVIDELRIYSRTLTPYEVYQLYLGYDTEADCIETLNEGLVYGSHFDSGTATDFSGNGNNGIVNGATATTDKNGVASKALNFDGVNDYVDTTVRADTSEGTANFWMKGPSATGTNREHYFSSNQGSEGLLLQNWNDGNSYWGWLLATGDSRIITSQSMPTTSWFMVTLTWSWNEGISRLYWDNVLIGTTTLTSNPSGKSIYSIFAGAVNDDGTPLRYSAVDIDEPRLYNRTLFADEITSLQTGYDNPNMCPVINDVSKRNALMFGKAF